MSTTAEQRMGLRWLASRGRRVATPTPYIDALLVTRNAVTIRSVPWFLLFGVLALVGAVGHVRLFGAAVSTPAYFGCFVVQLTIWRGVRSRQRQLAKHTRPWPGAVTKPLSGWFIAAGVLAYGGGAALALSMLSAAPAYAAGWLTLLGVSLLCGGGILISFVRAPVLAEDESSFAVYRRLLAENLHGASPSFAAVPPILDVVTHRLPPGYGPLLVAYAGLVVVAELIAYVRGRRPLPPGHYGVPLPDQSTVDLSPPESGLA
ncbi:hypothetical protein AB0C38_26270 [Amycolatopsis sp. NPDC048633]|uniref:hypothetical protein n=1 Tax=Amycolatopsis sp. NPDC048633 TaxID=3157095 RepID=UPI0033C84768